MWHITENEGDGVFMLSSLTYAQIEADWRLNQKEDKSLIYFKCYANLRWAVFIL